MGPFRTEEATMSNLNVNRVCLAGNLTRDPVMRKTGGGVSVTDISLAINEDYKNKEGELVKRTCFVEVVLWGRVAEAAQSHLHKGDGALVEGRLHYEQWETDKGEKRNRIRVNAMRLHFVGNRRAEAAPAAADSQEPVAVSASADDPMPF